MRFEFFIAHRLLKGSTAASRLSKPIVRISIWAIALGVLIMILAVSTGNGLRNEIKNKVIQFGGHLQILNYEPNPTYEQSPVLLDSALLKQIEALPAVAHLQAFGRKAGILKNGDLFEGAILKGIDQSFERRRFVDYLTAGQLPHYGIEGYQDSIVLSDELASRLKISLGDRLSMYFVRKGRPPLLRKFTVGGLFRTDFEEIDQTFLIGDLKHVRRLNKWDGNASGGYEIFLHENDEMDQTVAEVRGMVPYEYDALSARRLNAQLFQWLDLFDLNIIIILVIIVAVATVNMSIALLILIMERTRMIGTLKALGSTNFTVQRIFLINAAYLIGKGMLWGNGIALGLLLLQDYFGLVKLDPSTYYVSQVSVDLNPWPILALNLGTLLICLICLVLPSFLITRIRPVKALRFD